MTIQQNDRRKEYPGNNVAVAFTGPRAFLASHLNVYLVDTATGVSTLQTGGYTVSGVGGKSTTITMATPPPTGTTLLILRTVPYEQAADISNQGAYLPETLENAGFDPIVQQTQQLDDRIKRALQMDEDTVLPPGFSAVLPYPTPLWGLRWNASGTGIESFSISPMSTVGGAGLVGWSNIGVGMVLRTVEARLRDSISLKDAGALMDGATNDTAALNAAITAAGATGEVFLPGGDAVVTAFNNTYGTRVRGPGRLMKAITGGYQQLNSDADEGHLVIGREYLSCFHKLMLNSQNTAAILMSGDSTTNGDTTTTPYRPWEILKILGQERGFEITVANGGHSGKDTNDWVTTYLTADLATNPDLYIVRWGINDPFDGRTLAQFATSLRAGLAQIRASKTVAQMSVLLMVPNSTSDTPNGRDEKWYEQVRRIYKQVGREYQCAVFDTYAYLRDSRNGAAGQFMDNPFGDGRAIHPANVMNAWIYSAVADVLFPQGVRPRMFSTTYGNLVASTGPHRYPYGASLFSSAAGAADFGPTNASVMTQRSADGAVYQRAWSNYDSGSNNGGYPMPQLMERMGLGTTWYTNITEPSLDLTSLLVNSWVPFVTGSNVPRAKKTNNQVSLSGLIKNGTVTAGTTLFTLPAGYRPRNTVEAFLCAMGPTGTTTPCVIHVANTGVVTLQSAGNAAFVSLSGISFEVGA